MFICIDCNRTFDESELASWNEDRGEFWGQRCYETMQGCPFCHSCDYEEYKESEEIDNDG